MIELLDQLESILQTTEVMAAVVGGLSLAFLIWRSARLKRRHGSNAAALQTPHPTIQPRVEAQDDNAETHPSQDAIGECSAQIEVDKSGRELIIQIGWNNPRVRTVISVVGTSFFLMFAFGAFVNVDFLAADSDSTFAGFLFGS